MEPLVRLCFFVVLLAVSSRGSATGAGEGRGLYSPRVDYDEWTPLGRGDPLKNDPTYDYVPPVLDKVHYWVNPSSSRTPASPPPPPPPPPPQPPASRKEAFDPFLKFIDGPKFGRPQQFPRYPPPPPAYFYKPKYETSVSPPEPQVIQHLYTVLVPPPAPPTDGPAPSGVELHRAELVYESSGPWHEGRTQLATSAQPTSRVAVAVTAPATTTTLSTTTSTTLSTTLSTTSTTTSTTTAAPALTTDPLFSHYKQPVEPLRGPMYLIIQGHSKVKTYGSVKKHASFHGIPVRRDEDNDIGGADRPAKTTSGTSGRSPGAE